MHITSYQHLLDELNLFAQKLSSVCIENYHHTQQQTRKIALSLEIISTLSRHRHCLLWLSQADKSNLDQQLNRYNEKYLDNLYEQSLTKQELLKHSILFKSVFFAFETQPPKNFTEQQNFEAAQRVTAITNNALKLYIDAMHEQYDYFAIQTEAVASFFPQLNLAEKQSLIENLTLIRELWAIENRTQANENTLQYKFHKRPTHLIDAKATQAEYITNKIIMLFATGIGVLRTLSDIQLISLYARISSAPDLNETFQILAKEIYQESHLRYSYSRDGNSTYNLANRFKLLDHLKQQADHLEQDFLTNYTNNSPSFIAQISNLLNRHLEPIKGLALNQQNSLLNLLSRLSNKAARLHGVHKTQTENTLTNFHTSLQRPLNKIIAEKYQRDHFTKTQMGQRYNGIYEAWNQTLAPEGNNLYLRQIIAYKISQKFQLSEKHSVQDLRRQLQYRDDIQQILMQINLEDIFVTAPTQSRQSVNFQRLNYAVKADDANQYLSNFLNALTLQSSPLQLDLLYRHLINHPNRRLDYLNLPTMIFKQIRHRSSISKMLVAIMKGNKIEYQRLQQLKKYEQERQNQTTQQRQSERLL